MKTIISFLLMLTGFMYSNMILAQTKSIEKRLDSFIGTLPDRFNGIILIAIGDQILINKGYRMADLEFDIPNTSNTKYEIGSVTRDF